MAGPLGLWPTVLAVMHVPETLTVGAAARGSLEEISSVTVAPAVAVGRLVVVVRAGGVRSMLSVAVPPLDGLPATSAPLTATEAGQSVVPAGTV